MAIASRRCRRDSRRDRQQRQRADGRDGRRVAALLRRAVSSRGHAHAAGRARSCALRARDRGCERAGRRGNIIEDSVARVRAQVGATRCCSGLSGGVDSSVLAALLHRAIGAQLTCVFVDHGLLRLGEGDQVMATFAEHMGVRVIRVDAEERFSRRSPARRSRNRSARSSAAIHRGVRRGGGEARRTSKWLAQGTIYPDVIESAGAKTGKAHVIKSHHNVGGLPST
jgi:GMP synthase (glutamine-hydrolysing)